MRNVVLGCCAILFLSACAANNNTGISMDSLNKHVVLSDAELAKQLSFSNSRVVSLSNELEGEVTVTNNTQTDIKLQYRFNWYDLQGLEVDDVNMPWHSLLIHGRESVKLKDSPQDLHYSRAVHFRLSVQEEKK